MATESTTLRPTTPTLSPFTSLTLLMASKLCLKSLPLTPTQHKDTALNVSLYTNIVILATKLFAFIVSGSLSVLAALVDSALDILSQIILYWAERKSKTSSVAIYPVGATRYEPLGVIITAAVMGMGSLSLLKESVESIISSLSSSTYPTLTTSGSSLYSLVAVIVVKILLSVYCRSVGELLTVKKMDSVASVDAMYQDHFNDTLSNGVALLALIMSAHHPSLWFVDPIGAILISVYIMYSWYETGTEEIEKIVGRAAEQSLMDEIIDMGNQHHDKLKNRI